MLVRELLARGNALIGQGPAPETAWLDATVILAHCLGWRRERVLASLGDRIGEPAEGRADDPSARFLAACAKRADGYPVAYLTGRKEFFGRDYLVDESVLIPRPETEILVEWVLETVFAADGLPPVLRLLDCCTGSGCIALSLGLELPRLPSVRQAGTRLDLAACDLSPLALATAERNRLALMPDHPVDWLRGDLLAPWLSREPTRGLDLLTANPPYVPREETASSRVSAWQEPLMALDGGPEGLDLIRRLVPQAARCLCPGGWFFMEYGDGQSAAIIDILEAHGFYHPEIRCDLAGIPRMVRACLQGA